MAPSTPQPRSRSRTALRLLAVALGGGLLLLFHTTCGQDPVEVVGDPQPGLGEASPDTAGPARADAGFREVDRAGATAEEAQGEAAGVPPSGVSRGRYLVHRLAMCVQCHSPRDEGGTLVETRLLHGGEVPVEAPWPGGDWAFETPALAGLPTGYDRAALVHLLTTGVDASGESPRPPMPPFRMTREDAEAVADYLASLPRLPGSPS